MELTQAQPSPARTTPPNNGPRTTYEAVFDLHYAARVTMLHARLFGRVRALFAAVNLLGGTAAFAAFYAHQPAVSAWVGLVLAVSAIAGHVLAPGDRAARFAELYRRYVELLRDAAELTLSEIDRRLRSLQADPTPEFDALRWVAYNDALEEIDRAECAVRLTRWQRAVRWLV